MERTIFILGCGYVAGFLTPHLLSRGFKVLGSSRNSTLRHRYQNVLGVELFDWGDSKAILRNQKLDAILVCVPPGESGDDPVISQCMLPANLRANWIGYLSSTSVYGDHHGGWVTETAKPIDPTPHAKRRINAEQHWLAIGELRSVPVHIFRLAGIYGPGRSSLERLMRGVNQSIFRAGQFFSRIHVEDISRALLLSIDNPTPGAVFNLADDSPASNHEVNSYAASLLGLPEPQLVHWESAALSKLAREFFQGNRRVSNSKIKRLLGWNPLYPSYREGILQSCLPAFKV